MEDDLIFIFHGRLPHQLIDGSADEIGLDVARQPEQWKKIQMTKKSLKDFNLLQKSLKIEVAATRMASSC